MQPDYEATVIQQTLRSYTAPFRGPPAEINGPSKEAPSPACGYRSVWEDTMSVTEAHCRAGRIRRYARVEVAVQGDGLGPAITD